MREKEIELSGIQRYVMLAIKNKEHGFVMPQRTEAALIRKGMIEANGALCWRLTNAGYERAARMRNVLQDYQP